MSREEKGIPRQLDTGPADLLWTLAIIVLSLAPFLLVFISGRTSLWPVSENFSQWLLYRTFINESFASGHFPLWCKGLMAGMPFGGWGHGSSYYPLAFFFFFLDFTDAVTLNTALHLAVAGTGFYFLCRAVGAGRSASGVASLWLGLSCLAAVYTINFLPQVFCQSLAPWTLFFLVRLLCARRLVHFMGCALVVMLQVLAGHFEYLAHQYLLLSVCFLAYGLFTRKQAGTVLAGAVLCGGALILGSLFSALVMIPSMEYVGQSIRSLPISYEMFTNYAGPRFLIHRWDFGQLSPAFLFIFAAGTFTSIRDNRSRALVATLVLAVLYVANPFDLQKIFHSLPVFGKLLFQWRMNQQMYILAGILAAIGLDTMLSSQRRWWWALAACAVIFGSWFWFGSMEKEALSALSQVPVDALQKKSVQSYLLLAPWLGAVALGTAAILVIWRRRIGGAVKVLPALLLSAQFALPVFLFTPSVDKKNYEISAAYENFARNTAPGRTMIMSRPSGFTKSGVPPQAGVLFGTEAISAYITAPLRSYAGFIKSIFDKTYVLEDGELREINFIFAFNYDGFLRTEKIPLLDMLGLRYIVGDGRNPDLATESSIVLHDYRWTTLTDYGKEGPATAPYDFPPIVATSSPSLVTCSDIYVEEDSSLMFGAGLPESVGSAWGSLLFERQKGGKKRLLFARAFDEKGGAYSGGYYSAELGGITDRDSLYDLYIASSPHLEEGGGKGQDFSWSGLTLTYPGRHYKRIPVDGLRVFYGPTTMPRAFLVSDHEVIRDERVRIERLANNFAPWGSVILEEEPGAMDASNDNSTGPAEIISRTDQEVRIGAASREAGWLVLSDAYYPGWKAIMAGKEKRIYRANQAFRAVSKGPGSQIVVMRYEPASFGAGLWISVSSVVFALLVSVVYTLKRVSRRHYRASA